MTVEKMPVTILQEMAVKIGSAPVYELCPSELKTISPIFTFKVSCDDLTAYGSGKSKRDAKQNAAQTMIEKISQRKVIMESSAPTSIQDNTVQELMVYINSDIITKIKSHHILHYICIDFSESLQQASFRRTNL